MADIYVDPDTGEEFTEDQVDWSKYKGSVPEESFLKRTANRITAGVSDTLGGLAGAAGFGIENDPLISSFLQHFNLSPQQAAEPALDFQKSTQDYSSQLQNSGAMDTSSTTGQLKDYLSQGIAGVSKLIPGMAFGPLGLPIQLGTETLGQEYGRFRNEGMAPPDAGAIAGERGAVDYLSGLIPMGALSKVTPGAPAAVDYLKSMVRTPLSLEAMNAISSTNRAVTDQLMVEDKPLSEFSPSRALSEVGAELSASTPGTIATGALLGPLGVAQRRAATPTLEPPKQVVEKFSLEPEVKAPATEPAKAPSTDSEPFPEPTVKTNIPEPGELIDPITQTKPLATRPETEAEVMNRVERDSEPATIEKPPTYQEQLVKNIKTFSAPEAAVTHPELSQEAKRYQEYWKHPDLVEKLDEQAPSLRDESGAIKPEFLGGNVARNLHDSIKENYLKFSTSIERMDAIMNQENPGSVKRQQLDPAEYWMRGQIKLFGNRTEATNPLKATWIKYMTRPLTIAKRDPKAMELWRAKEAEYLSTAERGAKIHGMTADYFDALDHTNLNKVIHDIQVKTYEGKKQGKDVTVTPEALKESGLTDDEVNRYFAGRKALDYIHDELKRSATENIKRKFAGDPKKLKDKLEKAESFFQSRKLDNFWPETREGKYFVFGEKEGSDPEYYKIDKLSEREDIKKNLNARGFKVRYGDVRKVTDAAYENMPIDLSLSIADLIEDPDFRPMADDGPLPMGFTGHFVNRKMIAGADTDMAKSLARYLTSANAMIGKLDHRDLQKRALTNIDERSPVYQEMSDWLNYSNTSSNDLSAVKSFISNYHMGFGNPAAATLNSTQTLTVTYPELSRRTDKPWKALSEARRLHRLYQRNPEALAKSNPELYSALEKAKSQGVLGDDEFRALHGIAKGDVRAIPKAVSNVAATVVGKPTELLTGVKPEAKDIKSWTDLSMLFNSVVEKRNRTIAFIAGYNTAPKNADKLESARDFTNHTQFIGSKLNRPRLGRGKTGVFYTLRNYGHNWWGNLNEIRNELLETTAKLKGISDEEMRKVYKKELSSLRGARNRYLGTAAALGGLGGLPFISAIASVAAANGYDLKKKFRESVGNETLADTLLNGPSHSLLGVALTGSIDPNNITDFDKGALGAVSKLAFGTVSDLWVRPAKAKVAFENAKGDTPDRLLRAVEEVLPRQPRNMLQAYRVLRDGELTDIRGKTTLKDPSLYDVALKALSFQPASFNKANEKAASARILAESAKAETEGLVQQLSIAIQNKDRARVKALLAEAQKIEGYDVDRAINSAIDRIEENKNPDLRALKSVPKRKQEEMLKILRLYK